jgi:hypothetical protein
MGCLATVWIPKHQRTKLDAKTIDTIMVGYDDQSKGYRLYCPSDRKVYISCNVEFNKNPGHSIDSTTLMDSSFLTPSLIFCQPLQHWSIRFLLGRPHLTCHPLVLILA